MEEDPSVYYKGCKSTQGFFLNFSCVNSRTLESKDHLKYTIDIDELIGSWLERPSDGRTSAFSTRDSRRTQLRL